MKVSKATTEWGHEYIYVVYAGTSFTSRAFKVQDHTPYSHRFLNIALHHVYLSVYNGQLVTRSQSNQSLLFPWWSTVLAYTAQDTWRHVQEKWWAHSFEPRSSHSWTHVLSVKMSPVVSSAIPTPSVTAATVHGNCREVMLTKIVELYGISAPVDQVRAKNL